MTENDPDPGSSGSAADSADPPRDADDASESADRGEKPARQRKKRPFWIELPILILIAFGLTFLIQTFIAKVYYVPSGSMEQTLHGSTSGGDRILANKIVYDFRDPAPGDVIVFAGPPTWVPGDGHHRADQLVRQGRCRPLGSVVGIAPPDEKDYVKRVIAVGGQTVMCCDTAGNVVVDGTSLNEPYIYEPIEFVPGELDCTTVPDVPALLRSGDHPRGPAVDDGRPPVRLRRLLLPVPGHAGRRRRALPGADPGRQRHREGGVHRDAAVPMGHHRRLGIMMAQRGPG